jgi:hydroxymethylpyrimidine pyrophosphatase-like HAD family hydrolase
MIKAILLDVDGVIIGTKQGINFPQPNEIVIRGLQQFQDRGIPISLITAKPSFSAIKETIQQSGLRNLHITDAGSVLIDSVDYTPVQKHPFPKELLIEMIKSSDRNQIYWEIFTIDNWYAQEGLMREQRVIHEMILEKPQTQVFDILATATGLPEVIQLKVLYLPEQRVMLERTLEPFKDQLELQWGGNPNLAPCKILNINPKGISKKSGAFELAKRLNVEMTEILGIGDTLMDWEFIGECGYAGAMGNSSQEFMDKVKTKLESHYYVGKHVDENGVLDIIQHFDKMGELKK